MQNNICCSSFCILYTLSLHIPSQVNFVNRKMPNFLKRLSAKRFVSSHRFDYFRSVYVGKKHHHNFLVSLSGHLHKVDITCGSQNSLRSNRLRGHMTFCVDAHVRETTKALKRCFFNPRTQNANCSNLGKRQIIKIAESLFVEISAFF